MSRSYRKPCFKDCKSGKKAKQDANRKLRRTKIILDIGQYCNYKRYYCSYNIYDYKVVWYKWDLTDEFKLQWYNKLRRK